MAKLRNINKLIEDIITDPYLKSLVNQVHKYWYDAEQNRLIETGNLTSENKLNLKLNNKGILKETDLTNSADIQKASDLESIRKKQTCLLDNEEAVIPKWAVELEKQKTLLDIVKSIDGFQDILYLNDLTQAESESMQLMRFITRCSQWNTVIRVWEYCAANCKHTGTKLEQHYESILENTIQLYNLTLSNNQSKLVSPKVGDDYDYTMHFKLSGDGDSVEQVLIPALYSASGELVKQAIIIS